MLSEEAKDVTEPGEDRLIANISSKVDVEGIRSRYIGGPLVIGLLYVKGLRLES